MIVTVFRKHIVSFFSPLFLGNGINTWDIQFWFTLRLQNQLAIYPSVNLVTNIGIKDPRATHKTSVSKAKKLYVPSQPITFPLAHPRYMLANRYIDDRTFRHNYFSYKRLLRFILKRY
jgi:hypothetical protein